MERFPGVPITPEQEALTLRLRAHYQGILYCERGYDEPRALDALRRGHAHAIAFGRPFISTRICPERTPGSPIDRTRRFNVLWRGEKGYTIIRPSGRTRLAVGEQTGIKNPPGGFLASGRGSSVLR